MSITQKTRGGNLMQASICVWLQQWKSMTSQLCPGSSETLDDTASQKQQISEGLQQSKWIYSKEIKSG